MSAELETRLELARRHEFCSTFTFYNRSPDSVHFLKNSFDVLFFERLHDAWWFSKKFEPRRDT